MQNNLKIEQFNGVKGMQKDVSPSFVSSDLLQHMRNGSLFSHDGEFLAVSTEQSNRLITTLPYPIVGHIKLPNGTWALFLTDNISSEIGVFDEKDYSYKTFLKAEWLNFNRSNIITGAGKEDNNGNIIITFADGRRNPDRRINLNKLPTNPDASRLALLTKPPLLSISKGNAGTLPNGSYQAIIRYSLNQKGFGSYYSLTLPEPIWSDMDNTGALDVSISSLDNDFDYFELIIIQTVKETTTAKVVGTYPRATSKVHISNFNNPSYINVELADITTENQVYIGSDQIVSTNEYLFRVGVETIPELNYQLQAFDIHSEYVVHQYPENYHSYGSNVGHYRDEVYSYYIQWLHKIGSYSSAFTIAGRKAEGSDLSLASTNDVYEALIKNCEEETVPYFLAYNTAQEMVPIPIDEESYCEGQEIGYGKMAYYESTDTYPDNIVQYGANANKSIRHHKFPDEEKAPRYSYRNGKAYINILGIRFKNIPHPKKADGTLDEDWIGYRIIRVDRNGNRSIISRGMVTNVRSYQDNQNENREIFYTNYPYNDLRPDSYLSSTQVINKNNKEQNFTPLSTVHYNKLNYYSPSSYFSRASLGEELKIEMEEVAEVRGEFSEVYRHPKQKLLSLFSFWLACILGSVESLLTVTGKSNFTSKSTLQVTGLTSGTVQEFDTEVKVQNVEDLIGLNPIAVIAGAVKAGSGLSAINVIRQVITGIAALGLKVITFTFWGIQYANQIIDVIDKFLGYTNYTLQYNSHAFFHSQSPVPIGDKRRFVSKYQYLAQGLQTINNSLYNNFGKHSSVYIETNQEIGKFKNEDNSRQTISDFGIGDDITRKTSSQAVAYYATSKRKVVNQYGRIESNINFVLTHNNFFEVTPKPNTTYSTPTIFGGDCYINRFTIQTKHQFFTQNQVEPLTTSSILNGQEFNYNLYRNIAYPRFWADFFKYDFSEFISRSVLNFTRFARTVTNKHNLDNKGKDDQNKFRVDNAYFYLSNNGVLDFFVESDYNLAFREKSDNDTFFYSDKYSSLQEIFRSDRLLKEEQFKYNQSLSTQATQIYAQPQPTDYSPDVYNSVYKYCNNRLIYSLPSFSEYKYDNWQYFLTGNSYKFDTSEFGNLTSVHRVDGDRILFLFDRSSPYITLGRSELQVSNDTITIGDGGLFARPPRELLYTEQHYGNSQSRFGAIPSQFGTYYVSERQGRFMKFNQSLDEVTRNGLQAWSKIYFPIKLTQKFNNLLDKDNPTIGVGYFTSFDAQIDMIYISKKDYLPTKEKEADITYNSSLNQFFYKGITISLTDPNYFDNLSFTLSFSPTLNAFVSFHDWFPDWTIPTEKHFITAKYNKLYIHNDDAVSAPCNFYNIPYPFEVAWIVNNKLQVETLSSLEYYLTCEKYKEDGINKVELFNENFDKLIVSTPEQVSGLLTLHPQSNNPFTNSLYPKPNSLGFDILYSKKENKYKINDIRDITKDRQADIHLIHQLPDGYKFNINPLAIDVQKSPFERKLFRNNQLKVWLSKSIPTSKMILRLVLEKELPSSR